MWRKEKKLILEIGKEENRRKLICNKKVKLIGSQSSKLLQITTTDLKLLKRSKLKIKKIVGLDTHDNLCKEGIKIF